MSYIEIYNENIRDLLNPGAGPLELRDEGGSGAPTVAGLSEVKATSAAHVSELLTRGDRARTAEPTHANQHSSRGHALLRYIVFSVVFLFSAIFVCRVRDSVIRRSYVRKHVMLIQKETRITKSLVYCLHYTIQLGCQLKSRTSQQPG